MKKWVKKNISRAFLIIVILLYAFIGATIGCIIGGMIALVIGAFIAVFIGLGVIKFLDRISK